MTFEYERIIAVQYSRKHDKYFEQSYEFEYYVHPSRILDAIVDLVIDDANGKELNAEEMNLMRKITKNIIVDNDLQDKLEEKYYKELKEMFEQEALDNEVGD